MTSLRHVIKGLLTPPPPRPPPPAASRPLTSRECADWMGFTPEWIRCAIHEGVTVRGKLVKLEAEALTLNGRRAYRVHQAAFVNFLIAIGCKHLPAV